MLLIQILWNACDNNFNVATSMKTLYVIVVRAAICTSLEIASKFFSYLTKSKKLGSAKVQKTNISFWEE